MLADKNSIHEFPFLARSEAPGLLSHLNQGTYVFYDIAWIQKDPPNSL